MLPLPSFLQNWDAPDSDNPLPPLLSVIMAYILARYTAHLTSPKDKQQSHQTKNSKEDINPLVNLIKDVKKFNSIVKAIDVNDQLEEAGNQGMSLNDRSKAIEALKLARQDLVRALKTEKILRENKDVILSNPDLFTNNLSGLRAIEVSEKASEFGKILSNALQVAIDVQEEMKKLQNQHI
jgi:NACalpha-BTF3-like transcription factor